MTIEEISGILTRSKLEHSFDDDGDIRLSYESENYVNSLGEKRISFYIHIGNEGKMFSITTIGGLELKDCKNMEMFFKVCSLIQAQSYLVQFEYLPTKHRMQLCIELPLLDNKLTSDQVHYCTRTLLKCIEDYYAPLTQIIQTGSPDALPESIKTELAAEDSNGETTKL